MERGRLALRAEPKHTPSLEFSTSRRDFLINKRTARFRISHNPSETVNSVPNIGSKSPSHSQWIRCIPTPVRL